MRTTLFAPILYGMLSLAGACKAITGPKAPGLELLYTLNVTSGEPIPVGPGPRGIRLIVPLTGGTFSGPKLKGTALPLGADWGLIDLQNPNTTFTADIRQAFKTDDGAFIHVTQNGEAQANGQTFIRVAFETGAPKYAWLNSVVGVGIVTRSPNSNVIINDVWQLTLPH